MDTIIGNEGVSNIGLNFPHLSPHPQTQNFPRFVRSTPYGVGEIFRTNRTNNRDVLICSQFTGARLKEKKVWKEQFLHSVVHFSEDMQCQGC
jgi:hypothetical protein